MSIMGELPASKGSVVVKGTIGYVSQQPWIFSGSVRQNILFGQRYDAERYDSVIRACALEKVCFLILPQVCTRLAQLVRSLTANQKVPGSIPSLVEGLTLGDFLSPHRLWTGTLSRWSSLPTFCRGT